MSAADAIPLRPHHGLCIQHFVGKGYSPAFTENMARLISKLKEHPAQEILLCEGADILCGCCPHNEDGICAGCEKVAGYDARCLSACGLQPGPLPWKAFQRTVFDVIIAPGRLQEICMGCQWLTLCLENSPRR